MARKGLFLTGAEDAGADPLPRALPGAAGSPLGLLRADLGALVREIDPERISDSAPADRLPGPDPELDALVESIRAHGQVVPALLRPAPEKGRFEIVYGRRRLAAVRRLGQPLRAVIQELDETAALLAQGAENNRRLDPSYLERALFAARLVDLGMARDLVADVLGAHPTGISRMLGLVETVGAELLAAIGPCHDLGRRAWEELLEALAVSGRDPATFDRKRFRRAAGDPDRYRILLDWAREGPEESTPGSGSAMDILAAPHPAEAPAAARLPGSSSPARSRRRVRVRHACGTAVLSQGVRGLSIDLPARDTDPDFLGWVAENPEAVVAALHAAWTQTSGAD